MHITRGIILKKSDSGETNSIFSIFTEDFGRITAFAQGVKKEEAKLKGHVETLNLVDIGLVSGKNGFRVVSASGLNFWQEIKKDFSKFRVALYLASLVDGHCMVGQKDEGLWSVALGGLTALEAGDFSEDDIKKFIQAFKEKFLEGLGYGGSQMEDLESSVSTPLTQWGN